MKKMVGIFLAMTLALSMFAGFSVSAATTVGNKFVEDFEGDLSAWGTTINGSSIVVDETTSAGTGTNSLKITTTTLGLYATLTVPVTAGKYVLEAKYKLDSTAEYKGNADFKAQYFDAEGTYMSDQNNSVAEDTDSSAWQQTLVSFTVPEGATSMRIWFRNTRTNADGQEAVLWYDDIAVYAIDPDELLTVERTICTGGWTGKNGTLTFTSDGTMTVTGHTNGSYAEAGSLVLTPGTTYRLAFQWKTNSMNKTRPTVKVFSTYTVNEATSKTYFTMEAGDTIKYTDYSSALKNPVKAVLGGSLDEVTNTTSFKEYIVYFTVPNFSTASVYNATTIWIGQSGYYNSGLEESDWATIEIDNVSLKKDYDEITFFDANGAKITEMPQTGTVTARIHLAGAGTADAIVNRGVFAAAYVNNTVKQLADIEADIMASGKRLTELDVTVTETDAVNMPAANVIVPQTVEYTFDAATLEADDISVYLWESVSGMKPIEKATISVAAADAAE